MASNGEAYARKQRWVSETEPELGLGTIIAVEKRTVAIAFATSGVERCYAIESAPIRRVRYGVGDWVERLGGESFQVETVQEDEGLLTYHGNGHSLCETELSDRIRPSSAKQRLLAGLVDKPSLFELRINAWQQAHAARLSPARGFRGGRISLLLHQFYIAQQVAKRPFARVLLSDETGLGKTIEACLIMQRLIVSGRVSRVLILVPESMVHQWFVELLRKFHLTFTILDEAYCQQSAPDSPDQNPFLGVQMGLINLSYLTQHGKRLRQAIAAPWDLVMVDEAHHLKEGTVAYHLVADLASRVDRVFLLTATPEQLGQRSHFARLKILDPHRYQSYDTYLEESRHYRHTAEMIEKIYAQKPLSEKEFARLEEIAPAADLAEYPHISPRRRHRILLRCLDRHGPGRVMFRNTRRLVKGFSGRRAYLVPLKLPPDRMYHLNRLANDFLSETGDHHQRPEPDFTIDPRIDWLAELIKSMPGKKILLICTTPAKVRAIHAALTHRIRVDAALFHEELTLLQRDRNAAWFAEPEGARLLICSEIGSEGRNFQFASHLVLFDLPMDPEQLEQRIGRLDRIGQKTIVRIHVPYLCGSPQEVLVEWFHKGLNQFEHHFCAGPQIIETFGEKLRRIAGDYWRERPADQEAFAELLADTLTLRNELDAKLAEGRDRLLQYASFQPLRVRHLVKAVLAADRDRALERLMNRLFDHFGIESDSIGPRTYKLSSGLRTNESFPLKLTNQVVATFDRETALKREDHLFLSWDHPLVEDSLEMLFNSTEENCTAGHLRTPGPPELIFEAVYILECICHKRLHADRFLPATPLRVAVDRNGRPLSSQLKAVLQTSRLEAMTTGDLKTYVSAGRETLLFMLKSCRRKAESQVPELIHMALNRMEDHFSPELARIRELAAVNPHVGPQEIQFYEEEIVNLKQCLSAPTLRLDALRLVVKTDA